jgi:glycosyltransferase involved in cell wall biosynthesis
MPLAYFVDEIQSPFVINDIKRVASKVDIIYLFSVDVLEGKEDLPNNVIVFEEFVDWNNYKPLNLVLKNLFPILSIYISECFAIKKSLPFKKSIALLASNIFKAECVMNKLKTMEPPSRNTAGSLDPKSSPLTPPAVLRNPSSLTPNSYSLLAYSFWFYDCIYLAWMRKKGWISKAVSRAHSGDLYEDHISIRNKILFRNFQFKNIDKIFPVSNMGTKYLQDRYLNFKNKIETIYLGSADNGLNPFNTDTVFTIVSCASFRHHKRIHKIAEMLQFVDFPLRWFHIGDERLNSEDPKIEEYKINKEKLKENNKIEYAPLGSMSNDEIFNFYKSQSVNLFISLSAIEGIPVSIMEAISFGIPILSTDVGGCKEIVAEETGILIPLETEMNEVANIITEFKDSFKNTAEFRKGVRTYWEEHFDAEKNYKSLFKQIENETN